MEFEYSVAIRTLGTAGEKYLRTLQSLKEQTIPPKAIIVYIAEGYDIPKGTDMEKYVYVKKGMISQRALPYNEIETDYLLATDDDVYYPPTAIEEMYRHLKENHGNVIAPDPFPHDKLPVLLKFVMIVMLSSIPYIFNKKMGYGVSWWGAQRYRNNLKKNVYESTSNAGMCFLCRKSEFLSIHFEQELWLEDIPYAIGEDQLMFYKMHKHGLKILTWYNNDIEHLDAGASTSHITKTKKQTQAYCLSYFRHVFWWKYLYKDKNFIQKIALCVGYFIVKLYDIFVMFIYELLKKQPSVAYHNLKGLIDAQKKINSGKIQ